MAPEVSRQVCELNCRCVTVESLIFFCSVGFQANDAWVCEHQVSSAFAKDSGIASKVINKSPTPRIRPPLLDEEFHDRDIEHMFNTAMSGWLVKFCTAGQRYARFGCSSKR